MGFPIDINYDGRIFACGSSFDRQQISQLRLTHVRPTERAFNGLAKTVVTT